MPRTVSRNATGVILTLVPRDNANDPIGAIAFNAAGLAIHWRSSSSETWNEIELEAGTAGTWSSGGWVHLGDGVHQLGLPNNAIVPGDRTLIHFTLPPHPKQYDAIDAVEFDGLTEEQVDEIATAVGDDLRTAATQLLFNRQMLDADEIVVVQRDDYLAGEGRAFERLIEREGVDFTFATVVAGAGKTPGAPTIVPTASLVSPTIGSVILRLEFTSAQLDVPADRYVLDAHIVVDTKRLTEVQGPLLVLPKYADAAPED